MIVAVVLTLAGAPLALLLLLYFVGVVFSIVWWLMTKNSRLHAIIWTPLAEVRQL